MKTIKLSDIFNSKEIDTILDCINSGSWATLRLFLNQKKRKLKKKGILPDYLFYWLESNFRDFDFVIGKDSLGERK